LRTLLVTGASGFLGSAVTRMAVERGYRVRPAVRTGSPLDLLETVAVPPGSVVYADMTDVESLRAATRGMDSIIHCAAATSEMAPDLEMSRQVNVKGTESLLDAFRRARQDCAETRGADTREAEVSDAQAPRAWARRTPVRRFIQISSQSAHPGNPSVYGRTKMEADEHVRAATDIGWTILKPSIIYGPQARGVFAKMVGYCRNLPVIPIPGSGKEEMRPIHVDDVAWAALACLEEPRTIGQTYDLGGADVLTFDDFIGEILKALGRRKPLVHLPVPLLMAAARILSLLMKNPPLTPDNVRGIETAHHVDISAAQRDFGFAPRSFAQGLRQILAPVVKGE